MRRQAEITLPTLHPKQVEIWHQQGRLNAVRCGRRWGKTRMMVTMTADAAIKGRKVGIFTPEYKQLNEPYDELLYLLNPVKLKANKNEGTIRTTTGGVVDFWPLNDLAGRGREYDLVMIDEAAFTKNTHMLAVWERSIKPTMLTRPGSRAWVFSTPRGDDTENFFWRVCNDHEMEFTKHYAPTSTSPYVPLVELEEKRRTTHPQVFQQEYLADFVNFNGTAFFKQEHLLVDGQPLPWPKRCDYVFATIDTAVKSGLEHDCSAVIFWSYNAFDYEHPLLILDYDIVQIDGVFLEHWVPSIFRRLADMTQACGTRLGSLGAYIEDKQTGTILLQQAPQKGWPAEPIDSKLTAMGKSERAIAVSGYVFSGRVKITDVAFDREDIDLKGIRRNHLLAQLSAFRVGDKERAKAADDLADCFFYGIFQAFGTGD